MQEHHEVRHAINTRRAIDLSSHEGRDELLRNEESKELTMELNAARCVRRKGRGEQLSAMTQITSELGEANETIR